MNHAISETQPKNDVNSVSFLVISLPNRHIPLGPYACCGAQIPVLEPLIPVAETRRRPKAPRKSCVTSTRVSNVRKKKNSMKDQIPEDCKALDEIRNQVNQKPSKKCLQDSPRNGLDHPNDCCCVECEQNEKYLSGARQRMIALKN